MRKRVLTLLLSLTVILSGCGAPKTQSADLRKEIEKETREPLDEEDVSSETISSDENALSEETELPGGTSEDSGREDLAVSDFAVQLFQQSMEEDSNMLISPISVLYALAMTANGAEEETLAQMEKVFGLPVAELNEYLSSYINTLPEGDKYKVCIANSIWLRDIDSLSIRQDFLQTNAEYYDAEIYKAPFDASTLKEINEWVSDNTDGMITNMLNEIPEETMMYLVNALTFDAEWQTVYEEYQIRDDVFTKEDGTTKDVELMYSSEQQYLEDDNATGFLKYYKGHKYAFAALLPNEGVSVADYASALTGEHLQEMLEASRDLQVKAAIPKYKTEYSIEMSDVLKAMGMTDAFDGNISDFNGMGTFERGNLFISSILHKTYISVDAEGTKAGAATAVVVETRAAIEPQEVKTVYLNRPFVYLLIDCENKLPLFIGTVMDIDE